MSTKLPKNFKWLLKPSMPKMVQKALEIYGTAETIGRKHNPKIIAWAKDLNIEKIYTQDETPWCGLAHAIVAKRAGKEIPLKGYDLLRAKKWIFFGLRAEVPMLGDTLIFDRPGGGHVGIYVGETEVAYHVLGGNQSNTYNITMIAKSRLYAARRPYYSVQPETVKQYFIDSEGIMSTNEE